MFKWSRRRPNGQPPTPKMTPVSLPFDIHNSSYRSDPRVTSMASNSGWERRSSRTFQPSSRYRHDLAERYTNGADSGWYSDLEPKPKMTPMASDAVPRRRSQTPHPTSAKPRSNLAEGLTTVPRTSAKVDGATDGPLKPLKSILKSSKASVEDFVKPTVPAPQYGRGACKLDQTEENLKPPKSILKESGHSHNATNGYRLERTSSYTGYPRAYIPPDYPQARPRHQSLTGHEIHTPRAPPSSRYTAKTHVVRVAQKEEAIALSWPLTVGETRGRMQHPLVYFDIWSNPRHDPAAIRAFVGRFMPMSEADRNLPASSHCVLTEMDITCPILKTSFVIKVERPRGIRCIDVFQEIFNAYDIRLTRSEQETLASDIDDRCRTAFRKRCRDAPHLPPVNERQGMRRVDLLKGVRIFAGLTRDSRNQTWKLEFHQPRE
jgi:hypothetical protein